MNEAYENSKSESDLYGYYNGDSILDYSESSYPIVSMYHYFININLDMILKIKFSVIIHFTKINTSIKT